VLDVRWFIILVSAHAFIYQFRFVNLHQGYTCREYQALPPGEREDEDLETLRLLKSKKWTRCPNCRAAVERISGCSHMSCRCRTRL
jgi:hypothetical protein